MESDLIRRENTATAFQPCVIEAGNSQSSPRLLKDKNWWFDKPPPNRPRGDVTIVIIIKVYFSSKCIHFEQWDRGQEFASQTVIIKPSPAFSVDREDWQTHWVVDGAPLKIRFEDVFLLSKEGQECDFVLDEGHLAKLAISCWRPDRNQE